MHMFPKEADAYMCMYSCNIFETMQLMLKIRCQLRYYSSFSFLNGSIKSEEKIWGKTYTHKTYFLTENESRFCTNWREKKAQMTSHTHTHACTHTHTHKQHMHTWILWFWNKLGIVSKWPMKQSALSCKWKQVSWHKTI